jgi:hypothetical protein
VIPPVSGHSRAATLTPHNATFSERGLDRHLAGHIAPEAERATTKAAVLGYSVTLALYDRTGREALHREDGADTGAGAARRRWRARHAEQW